MIKLVNVILISDGENHAWYDWVSTELVKRGHSFFYPDFPSVGKGVDEWLFALKDYRKHLDEDSVIIGHGFGGFIALKILNEKLREISGFFFISGSNFDVDFNGFDFSVIKEKSKNFFVYASQNDGPESLSKAENLAKLLDEDVLVFDGPPGFSGLVDFEDLLIDILSLIK